jgi:hypothetical protein
MCIIGVHARPVNPIMGGADGAIPHADGPQPGNMGVVMLPESA